ncbi:MAG TPA: hypothetical protein VJA16_06615 [Thermoanaerobaculia bacterium]
MVSDKSPGRDPIPIHTVLLQELAHQYPEHAIDPAEIEAERGKWEKHFAEVPDEGDRDRSVESALVGEVYRRLHGLAPGHGGMRTALCLSGGGIRSATFGLGVVQGLARRGLLRSFDYLSTVSGGGYMGGWLSGWIARLEGDVEAVERTLAGAPETPLEPDPEPVHHLREYSRYMSPRFGLLSADTWTLVAIFCRNLLLNWLVLVPLLAAVLLVPRLGVVLARRQPPDGAVQWVFWGAVVAGIVAIAFITANRPSLISATKGRRPVSRWPRKRQGQGAFLWLCLLPLAAMAIAVTLVWYWMARKAATPDSVHFVLLDSLHLSALQAFVLFGVGLHLGGFLLSRWWVRSLALVELVGVAVTGALGGLLAWVAAWLISTRLPVKLDTAFGREIYVCCAAPLLLVLFLLAVALFVALASKWTSDEDREWVARAAGWILIWVVARAFLSALVIFGPLLWYEAGVWTMGAVGGLSGLLTLGLGFGGKTGAKQANSREPQPLPARAAGVALALAAPLFALSLLVGLSALTSLGLRFLAEWLQMPLALAPGLWPHGFLNVIAQTPGRLVVGLAAALAALGLVAGYFVDVNRFSLHGAYRDRLIRAYLGASREPGTRRPNPFTGFDDQDNLELVQLKKNRPFHLVNVALNLVAGKELAWQDRKAESFTFSALHCGYRGGYRSAETYGMRKGGARVSLGTAVAISGAAASPNMGSHSSPVVTFLLALFNIRLGWWLGNPGPAGAATFDTQGPREAPAALAAETFGLTNDTNPYVYLSDGGHFENLGLYEMVLRRCRFIVVSDGSQDPKFQFEDLGNAISKIRIDLGVPIEFHNLPMRARPDLLGKDYDPSKRAKFPCFALARIRYSCVDEVPAGGSGAAGGGVPADLVDGWLLYVKPALNGTESADVFHYAKIHPDFPHESTGNQLYSEAQFESYRALGSWIVDCLPKAVQGDIEALFRALPDFGRPPRG